MCSAEEQRLSELGGDRWKMAIQGNLVRLFEQVKELQKHTEVSELREQIKQMGDNHVFSSDMRPRQFMLGHSHGYQGAIGDVLLLLDGGSTPDPCPLCGHE